MLLRGGVRGSCSCSATSADGDGGLEVMLMSCVKRFGVAKPPLRCEGWSPSEPLGDEEEVAPRRRRGWGGAWRPEELLGKCKGDVDGRV